MTTDTSVRRKPTSKRCRKVNALTFSIMCKLLMDGTRTCKELAEESGLHVCTVYDWTSQLHKHGVIHICMWDGEANRSVRIFKLGPGKDAVRPVKPKNARDSVRRARRNAARLLQRMAGSLQGETL